MGRAVAAAALDMLLGNGETQGVVDMDKAFADFHAHTIAEDGKLRCGGHAGTTARGEYQKEDAHQYDERQEAVEPIAIVGESSSHGSTVYKVDNAFHMGADYGFASFGRKKIVDVGMGVHEEVFGEYGGTTSVLQNVEAFFLVAVAIGKVGADALAYKILAGGIVNMFGEEVAGALTRIGVGFEAGGIHPFAAIAGGIDVYTDDNDIFRAFLVAHAVDTFATEGEGDIVGLGHQDLGIATFRIEAAYHLGGNLAGVAVFAESSVRAAFPGCFLTMSVVDQNFNVTFHIKIV